MPMPPALAAAIASKSGKKKPGFFKNVQEDTIPAAKGDPNKALAAAAQAKLEANKAKSSGGKKKKPF